jgi:hypothetical protein
MPGVIESPGGFTARSGNRARTLSAIRVFNEGNVPICIRAKARMVSGVLINGESAGNLGKIS